MDSGTSQNRCQIIQGDCLEVLRTLDADSIDSCVTDPPYGWRFMGKAWDGADIEKRTAKRMTQAKQPKMKNGEPRLNPRQARSEMAGAYDFSVRGNTAFQLWTEEWAREVYRVLKPGAHMLVFCGPRTYHRMASGVEDAGFEIRDQLQWIFGSGFPKNHNLGNGWGTALKPANEPICLARKPLEKGLTIAQNFLRYGTGAINIDECRVPTGDVLTGSGSPPLQFGGTNHRPFHDTAVPIGTKQHQGGRWPANVIHDGSDEVLAHFPNTASGNKEEYSADSTVSYGDEGSAARFFYCAKTSKADRNQGLDGMPLRPSLKMDPTSAMARDGRRGSGVAANHHPTVKPTALMEYLVRLVTPTGGLVLDPFLGSGSTMKAALINNFRCVGIELDPEYIEIAEGRLSVLQTKMF